MTDLADMSDYETEDAAKLRERQVAAKAEMDLYWARLLRTVEGRAVIWQIIRHSGFESTGPIADTALMAAFISRQNFGKEILQSVLTADPTSYITMQREADDREMKWSRGNV